MNQSLEGHADQRFDGDLNALHIDILEMGGLVLDQSRLALQSMLQQDLKIAQNVLEREPLVDTQEVDIDDCIVELINKRGPVSKDLRITMAFSKIVVDLERIGDEAAKIAHIVMAVNEAHQPVPAKSLLRDIANMGRLAIELLEAALESFDALDAKQAESLLNSDSELDEEFQCALRHLTTYVLEDSRNVGHSINITLMLKSLERLGAHAGNIAEYVIYLVHGVSVRHNRRAPDSNNSKQSTS